MTHWVGERPKPDFTEIDWAEKITKVAIERTPLRMEDPTPWHIWGRDYDTGHISETVWDFETFEEAVAAVPKFFEKFTKGELT